MSEYKYIERLKDAMEGEYSQEYINICIEYSKKLLERFADATIIDTKITKCK